MIRSRVHSLLESNPLLLRDLRLLKRRGWRTLYFALIVLILLVQIAAMRFLLTPLPPPTSLGDSAVRNGPFGDDNFFALIWYFMAIHAILHFLVAFWAFARARPVRLQFAELVVTPIMRSSIFWSIWRRTFLVAFSILLAIYLPLFLEFEFLYIPSTHGLLHDVLDADLPASQPIYYLITSILSDATIISILALPWISNRVARRMILFTAVLAFAWTAFCFNIPMAWSDVARFLLESNLPAETLDREDLRALIPTTHLTEWHPVLTLAYLLISTAYACGLGVSAGLRPEPSAAPGIARVILYGPVMEYAFYHVIAISMFPETYNPVSATLLMLMLYTSTAGPLWLGLKWNLLMAMSRREIRIED